LENEELQEIIQTLIKCEDLGHLLVTTRQHKVKVADMGAVESREIGEFVLFLPMFWTFDGFIVERERVGMWLTANKGFGYLYWREPWPK